MPQELDATFDPAADAAYFRIAPDFGPGEAVEQHVVERFRGDVVLDFDAEGRLLGVEVLGARKMLRRSSLDVARKLV